MLKSLIVVTTFLFAAAALAQGQCPSLGDIRRNLDRIVDRVELVPPDEANYIRAEKAKDLTTLLGVLLAGDDADTCLPGIDPAEWLDLRGAPTLKEALQCNFIRKAPAIARLRLARYCLRAGIFFAALGERLYGF